MKTGLRILSARVIAAPLCTFMFAASSMANEPDTAPTVQTDAATSLKRILEKAGEKGLLKLESDDPSDDQRASQPVSVSQQFDCHPSEVLDFWSFSEVSEFGDASKAKASISSYESVQDVIPVAQTFLALGLGTEAVADLRSFTVPEAKLLSSIGRIIDGTSSTSDVERVQSYGACGSMAEFWATAAQSAPSVEPALDQPWKFTSDQNEMLLTLPKHLSQAVTAMVGIHAAELGDQILAESLYAILEPQYRSGADPKNKSDEILYFFALLKGLKNDPASTQIFEHLASKDGVFQVRALLKLVKNSASDKDGHGDDHLTNLLSVQQQYRGKSSSRKVSLEIVNQQVSERQYAYAIDLTKKEFTASDSEYKVAVENVGAKLQGELKLKDKARQITALNGYLYDTAFFSIYSDFKVLQYLAHKAAVDLDLPEIAKNISRTAASITDHAAALTKDILLADVKSLFKVGDYSAVLKMGLPHAGDDRFRPLLKKASLKQGSREASEKIVKGMGTSAEKLEYQAEFANASGDWKQAASALRSLKGLEDEKFEQSQTLAIVEYVAEDGKDSQKGSKINTIRAAESLKTELDADIGLVKEFLTNG